MSPITIIWSMIAAACLTLAGINLLVWCRNRAAWANLFFSVTAASIAFFTFFELWMMRAETPEEFGTAMRWTHVPMLFWLVSTAWLVRFYLGAGRRWLAWAICGLRTFSLWPNFFAGQNLNYHQIIALRRIPFLNELVPIAEGTPNPWILVGQLSVVLLVFFLFTWVGGDPAYLLAGKISNPEQIENIRRQLGVDRPYYVQLWIFIQQIATGDFGESWAETSEKGSAMPSSPRPPQRLPPAS